MLELMAHQAKLIVCSLPEMKKKLALVFDTCREDDNHIILEVTSDIYSTLICFQQFENQHNKSSH